MFAKVNGLKNKLLKNELFGRTFKLSIITFLSNILGFLIPIYIAYVYGISKDTDGFFFSYGVVTFISTIFSGAISSVVVPFIKEKTHDKTWLGTFISTFFYYCSIYVSGLAVLLIVILLGVNYFIHSNFLFYIILSIPIFVFTTLNSFCFGVLNSFNQYNTAAMSPFSRAIVIFIVIFLLKGQLGIIAVILGYNLGELVKFIQLLYIIVKRNGIKIAVKDRDFSMIKSFVTEGSYQVLSTSISCASPLIDKIVASFLVVGSLSVLDYGDKVTLVCTIVLNAFLVIVLGKWSTEYINKTFRFDKMNKILGIIFCASFTVLLMVLLLRTTIANVLYPALSADKRSLISWLIVINMLGFLFNSVNQVVNIGNIAFKATSVMVRTSVIKAIINLVLDIIFGLKWGVIGIVVSTVFVHLSGLIINYLMFKSRVLPKLSVAQAK